eukprot:13054573-Heterocapsa_arctica.AAC.1
MTFVDQDVGDQGRCVRATFGAHETLQGEVASSGDVPDVQGQVGLSIVWKGRQRVEVFFVVEVECVMHEDAQITFLRTVPKGA